jgi:hypothetical protein
VVVGLKSFYEKLPRKNKKALQFAVIKARETLETRQGRGIHKGDIRLLPKLNIMRIGHGGCPMDTKANLSSRVL